MLSLPQKLFSVSFKCPEQIEELVEAFSKSFNYYGVCDSIAGWFKLHLDGDQQISTESSSPSCWEQVVFQIRSKKRMGATLRANTGHRTMDITTLSMPCSMSCSS